MIAESIPSLVASPPRKSRNKFNTESSKKAILARMNKSKETQAFIDSLHEQPIALDAPSLQEFIKNHPNKRREVIREILERNLFIRLRSQYSLIASGDPLKKAEARKEDLGIGLEYDKLYKEQESDALTVRLPSALVGRLSGVLALKISPVDTSSTPMRLDNQVQDASKPTIINANSDGKSVQE